MVRRRRTKRKIEKCAPQARQKENEENAKVWIVDLFLKDFSLKTKRDLSYERFSMKILHLWKVFKP